MGFRRASPWIAALLGAMTLAPASAQAPRASRLVDSAALVRDLKVLSADDMQGRETGTAGAAKARDYIIGRFRDVRLQPLAEAYAVPFTFTPRGRGGAATRTGVNVIGKVAGTRSPARYIVVSAHYDHVGVRNGQIYNGANDNASGAAALIALAAYFQDHRPQHSLIFAAFDAEEGGLHGARAFVAAPPVDRAALALNVNLDMIGRGPDNVLYAAGTFLNPFLRPLLQRVAASAPVTLRLGHDDPRRRDEDDWTQDSDHWAFQQAGIPAIYLGVEDAAQHHKATDDFETMTLDFFVAATETCLAVIKEFDAGLAAMPQVRR